MQNVAQGSAADNPKIEKVNVVHHDIIGNSPSTTPHSTNSSPAKSETETYSEHRQYMSDSSESEEDSVSEVESFVIDQEYDDPQVEAAKFLLNAQEDRTVDPETQARLEALLQAAGIGQLATKDGKHLADPEVLRRLTSSVSSALDEAAAALTRMRSDNPHGQPEKTSLVEACNDGDVGTVRKLLTEGRSVHETSEDGESLLSLACSAGYFELAQGCCEEEEETAGHILHDCLVLTNIRLPLLQREEVPKHETQIYWPYPVMQTGYDHQVLLAMHANVEDRGIKGECTPLMEAASAGHLDIVRLLVAHGADVNAQSTSGNTPLMYGCAGGHQEVVKFLLENGANVEDHNENGHTPLMEAASAGHVGLAKILLMHGAGINTHSNEFKESALTLACYKGHLDMVKFLLEAGADQEHKTDEMHTALMEASMDGHVEVARLLLDSGAQVNMPTDSFESPLTLAACGGHVDLAMLLIERGANIEEVNDEGYTPLMEAAREGHEDMVALLLSQGANINAQTDETQETALTLACCGGFTEVADFLIKAGADIELGASTPLMEAAQEGHLELVKYLLANNANVHAQTQTGDTALTYACENGHTDVADTLLQYGADLEHESEGGRTPLMKACRAGHLCTVQFLISKGANVRRQTTNNDHTPLSLACAGGHLPVVELLLAHRADPTHKLKDNSTMLIEAAKGGHTNVVQLLLDYPHSMMLNQPTPTTATNLSMLPGQVGSPDSPLPSSTFQHQPINFFQELSSQDFPAQLLQEVPEAVRIVAQDDAQNSSSDGGGGGGVSGGETNNQVQANLTSPSRLLPDGQQLKDGGRLLKGAGSRAGGSASFDGGLTSAEAQQVRTQPLTLSDLDDCEVYAATATMEFLAKQDPGYIIEKNKSILEYVKNRKKLATSSTSHVPSVCPATTTAAPTTSSSSDEGSSHKKQQILEELHRVDREFQDKQQTHNPLFTHAASVPQDDSSSTTTNATLPHTLNIDINMQQQDLNTTPMTGSMFPSGNLRVQNAFYTGAACVQSPGIPLKLSVGGDSSTTASFTTNQTQQAFYFAPVAVPLSTASSVVTQPIKFQTVTSHSEVSQSTAISDRPKAKPVSKKEGKNLRKQQQQQQYQTAPLYNSQQLLLGSQVQAAPSLQQQQPPSTQPQPSNALLPSIQQQITTNKTQEALQGLDLDNLDQDTFDLKDEAQENLLTASILQQFHSTPQIRTAFVSSPINNESKPAQPRKLTVYDNMLNEAIKFMEKQQRVKDTRDELSEDGYSISDITDQQVQAQLYNLQVNPYTTSLDESMIAATVAAQQDLSGQTEVSRVEYFAVPSSSAQMPVQHSFVDPYERYLKAVGNVAGNSERNDAIYQAGFQAGLSLVQHTLACPSATTGEKIATVVPSTSAPLPSTSAQTYVQPGQPCVPTSCTHLTQTSLLQTTHHCQLPCSQHHQTLTLTHHQQQQQQQPPTSHQVQAATQTPQATPAPAESKKSSKSTTTLDMKKKGRLVFRHQPQQQLATAFQSNQNYQIDPNSAITQYGAATPATQQQCAAASTAAVNATNFSMDVDSETESNHDTALTLACAGGHEELVELLLRRGADIEHRDKKGFTPLILAATAGHEKVVDILLKNSADIEAQSERTKDTPLSLACSGGRYEVVEILLNRNANKEHRNVSDYTPLSLAASGGYVNIIKLLLNHGAEINSRTGSKLGISPLMLAAMNGHTAAVKLLLDMGSDINAQIETNRNTALTLACFQGRHEVVSLLLDRKANVEHRAKTGLTPLMEAASGGYVEVGRVLLDKGADVNATPVPSSRDTALTIAADKGHVRFVELLLCRGAAVEVKNKKGNSPLWLAANGGHLSVVELLYNLSADIDSQDNRKVSCLMAAFRKGHTKVVKWMVNYVTQFPSDQEMIRYISTVNDKELLEKCQECVKIIRAAKETQAAKANKNASILLEELDMERNREESKKAAAARRRERKKKKKLEKKEEKRKLNEENKKNEDYDEKNDKCEDEIDKVKDDDSRENNSPIRNGESSADKEEGDSGIDANSQGSCSSNDVKSKEKRKDKKKKKNNSSAMKSESRNQNNLNSTSSSKIDGKEEKRSSDKQDSSKNAKSSSGSMQNARKGLIFDSTRSPAERDDFEATGNESFVSSKSKKSQSHNDTESIQQSMSTKLNSSTSPKQSGKREEGWKEVVRKSSVQTVSSNDSGIKKVSVPLNAISRVIGRGGSNINAIRGATGAHIEVEKQSKGQGERIITIKGTADATKHAHSLITILIRDPDVDILQMLPKTTKTPTSTTTLWDKTQIGTKKVAGKVLTSQSTSVVVVTPISVPCRFSTSVIKPRAPTATATPRVTAPRLLAQAEKNATAAAALHIARNSVSVSSHPSTITTSTRGTTKVITTTATQTFAAKLTEMTTTTSQSHLNSGKPRAGLSVPPSSTGPVSPQQSNSTPMVSNQSSPKHHLRPVPTSSAPPNIQHFPSPGKPFTNANTVSASGASSTSEHSSVISQPCSPTPTAQNQTTHQSEDLVQPVTTVATTQVYSLFNTIAQQPMWRREHESQKPTTNFAAVTGGNSSQAITQPKFVDEEPPQVDAAKAPGYRGTAVCSPVSSKTSSSSTTPPNQPMSSSTSYHNFTESKSQPLPPIGSNLPHNRPASQTNQNDMSSGHYFSQADRSMQHLAHSDTNLYKQASNFSDTPPMMHEASLLQPFQTNMSYSQSQQQQQSMSVSMSRLNPKAPDFLGKNQQTYHGYPNQLSGNQNSNNSYPSPIAKPIVPNFHRSAVVTQSNAWPMMQMPAPFNMQQTDIMSGMAGMTLQHIARATEALENGADLVNNSPAMSPNLPPNLMLNENHYMEDRSKPQPIGTERARKAFNPTIENANWMMAGNEKMVQRQQWSGRSNNMDNRMQPVMPRIHSMVGDDMAHLIDSNIPHEMPLDNNFSMHQFFYPQQQPLNSMRPPPPVFPPDLKVDLTSWETRPNMNDLQDKPQHAWPGLTNKWNQ